MDKPQYLDTLATNSQGLLTAARQGLDGRVPACPDWTVGHVLAHVGRAYNAFGEMIRTRSQQPIAPRPNDHSFDRRDPAIIPWFEASFDRYVETMRNTDVDESVWGWAGDNRAGFWLRLIAHETAIHRTDAESAHDEPKPIEADLATDGINGMLDWFLPRSRAFSLFPSHGERYLFRRADGDEIWLVTFTEDGVMARREAGNADVVIEAPASDLLLFLWHRLPPERLPAKGDRRLLTHYRDLVPGV